MLRKSAIWLLLALLLTSCLKPTPTPTQTPVATVKRYENQVYGFALFYPSDWKAEETGLPQPAVVISPPQGFPSVSVSFFYLPQPATPREAAQEKLKELQDEMPNFQLLKESEIAGGYILETSWTTQAGEAMRGIFFYRTRGSQVFEATSFSPPEVFEKNREIAEKIIFSLYLTKPTPLGLPRKQTLSLYELEPLTLDPHLSGEMSSHLFIVQLFGGLVSLDEKSNIIPDIAERWEISQDGTVYTFYLRRGVKFHNGKEAKASDVKYSWERATDPVLNSPTAPTYLGDIVGVKEKLAGKAEEIAGVKVIDDYTLEVKIDAPKPYFLYKLSYPAAFVIPKEVVGLGREWWRQKPIGTGPFKLKEWKAGQILVLERNADYHLGPPKLNYVLYRLLGGNPMVMYEEGEIDVAPVFIEDIDRASDPRGPFAKELKNFPELSLFYLGFNAKKPPFDNPDIRRAFGMAVDKSRIVKTIFKDTVAVADGILPPGFPGYNPALKPLGYDPEKAKELLAPYKDRLPEKIIATIPGEGEGAPDWLCAILKQWREVFGVDFIIREIEPKIYYTKLKEEKDDIFALGWMADYLDPENFLDVLFHSQSMQNFCEYSNPEVDRLLERARTELDKGRRFGLYRQVEQMLIDDVAVLPLWFGRSYFLVKPYVKGFALSPLGVPLLREVYLEATEGVGFEPTTPG